MRRPPPLTTTRKRQQTSRAQPATPAKRPSRNTPASQLDDDSTSSVVSVVGLIRDIQSGAVAPQSLTKDARQSCVEHLTSEGYSVPEIAGILKASDRTIIRDRAEIRTAHCVEASPELAKQMVGNMLREAEIVASRLRRATRGADIAVADKIEAEKAAWGVTRDVVHMLQRLGYLPTAPGPATLLQGQILSSGENGLAFIGQLTSEAQRIEQIVCSDPALAGDASVLRLAKKIKSTARALEPAPPPPPPTPRTHQTRRRR